MSQNDGDAGKKKREKANGARVLSPETGESPALTGIFLCLMAAVTIQSDFGAPKNKV